MFIVCAVVYFIGLVVYSIFGKVDLEEWANEEDNYGEKANDLDLDKTKSSSQSPVLDTHTKF